jgi:PAP2 superfamily
MGAPLKQDNPYRHARTQSGFVTFGAPHVLDCLARVAIPAMKASWCHKWLVHRRLRPEAFAARVHEHMTRAAHHPLASDVLHSAVLETLRRGTGSYLLPMAYPEGCPTHPAYPAAHAAIAGACATVVKAFFDESFTIPDPMVANADGTALQPWRGARLTVGGELNKLAANIALGRNAAGVHWRSDGIEGLRLGEAVASAILAERRATCPETFAGFTWSGFDGVTTRV